MGVKQSKLSEFTSDEKNAINSVQLQEMSETRQTTEKPLMNMQSSTPRMTETLRKRFFGNFIYNLNDPRSPGLNRTPLVIDHENDKTLNLDDTFADLFVANRAVPAVNAVGPIVQSMDIVEENVLTSADAQSMENPSGAFGKSLSENESSSVVFASLCEEETMPSSATLKQTPLMYQQHPLDPRSPTVGLMRTPIVFENEDAVEDAMLEDILAALSLDLSENRSFNSYVNGEISSPAALAKKPTNKHLERVKKPEKPKRKNKQISQKQKIYLDTENVRVTPKRTPKNVVDSDKRTPLSCMKNLSHMRSRSVESIGKQAKPRFSLTSYDDTLNPSQDQKIIDLHTFQGDPFYL